jgi:hypothetical protein
MNGILFFFRILIYCKYVMDLYFPFWVVFINHLMYTKKSLAKDHLPRTKIKRSYIGRVPPSQDFEYSSLNGFYSPKRAKQICENDFQCAGFTFKGTRSISNIVPEVYFFHFIDENSEYLTTEIKYPHWTTYIVGSRDYVAISGTYDSESCSTTDTSSK